MKVFNTLSGQKEVFTPEGDVVKMYVCGVTPYSEAHIGHAMSNISFDVMRRYLEFGGYKVKYVQNVTDIDDKIIQRANKLAISPGDLAEKYTASYFEDIASLNVAPADIYPRATREIPKIIEVIQGLVDRGYAYAAKGSVYFRVRESADYGQLSHRSLGSMMVGARVEVSEEKEYPMDFALWKASKPDEPWWESPWGRGRPGWHIECSAMALKYLGDTIDIHGGGRDLIFPHHENELAQSEGFTGQKPFVKYWLHNGLLQLGEEKMSKSLGNLITIKEALARYSADAIRIFVLSSHYRSPLTYSEEALEAAERGAERLVRAVSRDESTDSSGQGLDAEPYRRRFIEAMDDDFNTAQALAVLFDLGRAINDAGDSGLSFLKAQSVLLELARNVLGLKLETFEFMRELAPEIQRPVSFLVEARLSLRNAKQWQFADKIRAKLAELGIILEDTPGGTITRWKREFIRQPTPKVEPLVDLLVEAHSSFRRARQQQQADEIRAKLAELGIILEDTPEGTVTIWKRRR